MSISRWDTRLGGGSATSFESRCPKLLASCSMALTRPTLAGSRRSLRAGLAKRRQRLLNVIKCRRCGCGGHHLQVGGFQFLASRFTFLHQSRQLRFQSLYRQFPDKVVQRRLSLCPVPVYGPSVARSGRWPSSSAYQAARRDAPVKQHEEIHFQCPDVHRSMHVAFCRPQTLAAIDRVRGRYRGCPQLAHLHRLRNRLAM